MPICAAEQRYESGIQGFQAFYEDNLVSVYRFVFTSLRDQKEARDLTSQIFLKALCYLYPERSAQSARTWLFQIARTTIADYWRTHDRALITSHEARREISRESPTEEGFLEANDQAAERVLNLLQMLPERYREVLCCRFLLNLSLRETATMIGISEDNIKILQFRALRCAAELAENIPNP